MSPILDGKRILIVEDEYWIARDLAQAFEQQQAIVVGPVATVSDGMALVEDGSIDAAVLDVNLMGARSYPLADRLSDAAVPHIFVTGYDSWSLPESYRETPCISKPFATGHVVSVIKKMCEDSVS